MVVAKTTDIELLINRAPFY